MSQVTKLSSLNKALTLWLPLLFVSFAGGLLVILLFTTLAFQVLYLNRAYPGVSVAGVEVGGLTHPEIVDAVKTQGSLHLNRPITIQANNEAWTFTGQQLGLRVDVTAMADKAYQVGRGDSFLADMLTHLSLFYTPHDIEPIIRYDSGPANEILVQLSDAINHPPQNAEVIIHSAARLEIVPAQRGRQLHVGATQPLIEAAILSDEPHPVVVAFTQEIIPAIANEDIAAVEQQIQALLSQSLTLGFNTSKESTKWTLSPDTLADMINLVEKPDDNGKPQLTVELDRDKLTPYLEEFAQLINREPADARLKFDDEQEALVLLQPSQDGRTLDIEAAHKQVEVSVANGANYVPLPVLLTPPAISSDDLDSLGLKELVSEATSYFKGSNEGRMRNIALSASKFDGVIIPPGGIFSFNQHIGPITAEEGYDESLIIFGDRTTVGIGGGVCQVSTTVFRAAFFGGFELVERWAHGYRVGWYETNSVPGLDATIYTPDVDFKFRNDSDHHLLIHTSSDLDAGTVTFKFYGTSTGRDVIVEKPIQENLVKHDEPIYEETSTLPEGMMKQIDWAKDGMDVTVTRVVKDGDVTVHEDKIISRYRPWRAVYQVGTNSS